MSKVKKVEDKLIKVYVAILVSAPGTIHMHQAAALLNMLGDSLKKKKYEMTVTFSKISGVEYNRNTIVKNFLDDTDCEYLLMLDEDNPPHKNPLELLSLKKDVIAYPTLMWKGDIGKNGKIVYNIYKVHKDKKGTPDGWQTVVYNGKDKLIEIERAGAGCILIKRKVLEKIQSPFSAQTRKDGRRHLGEDILFCDKVREHGFKLWAHWDYTCAHYKVMDLTTAFNLLVEQQQKYENERRNIKNSESTEVYPKISTE